MSKNRLIFNPRAGKKLPAFIRDPRMRLNDLYVLLDKYRIDFEAAPSEAPGDVLRLAREAAEEKYDRVIVAGGDGTVGEAANALVGTDTALGIIPSGTYMNMARMLAIPRDHDRAAMLLLIGETRTIDAGEILEMGGKDATMRAAENQRYFFESVGVGLDAAFQRFYLRWKNGDIISAFSFFAALIRDRSAHTVIQLDDGRIIDADSHLVTVSNGPFMGAGIAAAETAKLDDHLLTVRTYRMSRLSIFAHFLLRKSEILLADDRIDTYYAKRVRVSSASPRPVHADGRVFGQTPVSLAIRPSALKVIAGFPEPDQVPSLTDSRPSPRSIIS
jgi:diacylglycerol kinase (ATP)